MSARISSLSQALLGKESIAFCTTSEIESLVDRYPFFAAAQVLLLHKLKDEDAAAYGKQSQRAALYHHQPHHFHRLSIANPEPLQILPADQQSPVSTEYTEEVISMPVTSEQQEATATPDPMVAEVVQEPKPVTASPVASSSTEATPPGEAPPLSFEPFHTVDYFASQGIKLSLDEAPKDKFGKQLKSFTEWLKTMKRLPPAELEKTSSSPGESGVVQLADRSINESDVYTEAMAEVWLKQGNKAKAIEVYNKLVLLNPSKKHYFAGLIENLKRS